MDEANPPASQELTVADRKSEFVAVEGGADSASASGLLVTAYVVMWALVFGFIVLTARRQRAHAARLEDLERALGALDREQSEPSAGA